MKKFIIGLDFDGTLVDHAYPRVGEDIGAFPWLKLCQQLGAYFILHTMRDGLQLADAVMLLESEGIELFGVNRNPEQLAWTTSPKPYCKVYVDDAAFGCPLICPDESLRPYVDWNEVGPELVHMVRSALT